VPCVPVKENIRVELLAIPLVAAIFGIGALVLFAATERRAVTSLRRQSERATSSPKRREERERRDSNPRPPA
jgi:hypothetical protein